MKKSFLLSFVLSLSLLTSYAQNPGDTIVVPTFNYSQTYGYGIRDTMVNFPNTAGLTFEKIYMQYNMRCKKGLVSSSSAPEVGCGQWDYNCQTYLVDSSKIDSVKATHANYIVTGFVGNTYNYTTLPTYTFNQYTQQNTVRTATLSETSTTLGMGITNTNSPFHTQYKSAKSQFLWTASELNAAGLTAGNISSLKLNVNLVGSTVQFLKIRMKTTPNSVLNASTPDLTGFTEVYFLNTALVNGVNEFKFYNNFPWNGTDNIIVEFSFTNAAGTTDNVVLSDNTSTVTGLVTAANDYNFEFNGNNLLTLANTNFSNFNNQITIEFWSNGNPSFLPTNTSILYATNTARERQLNIHLPWSNGAIFWDAGYASGSYDRASRTDSNNNFKGNWTHWAFTKNVTTGLMTIYINGVLWKQGTGKNIPLVITKLFLGADPDMINTYFGKIDELSIWNTELNQATLQNWMYKNIDASHPNYANLFAYYHFNEGTGTLCADASVTASSASVTVGSPIWNLYKGNDLFKGFTETTNRPQVTFVKGVYTQTNTPIVILDSTINIKNTVYHFGINGTDIVAIDTNAYFKAGYSYIYNGDNGQLIDSVNYAATGTINISPLNYYAKSPSRLQLMSFVTPYGINLDLGANGKTWTFDVSDFAPVLKGWKRLQVDAGGQWQEDMDIKFIFIVGTPPRSVNNIYNLWKVESIGYANLLNDSKCEPRIVKKETASTDYKIRSVISGHGQEGEFNPQTHYLNINNNATPQFSWDVAKICGYNPVYPQGGTWIYDRAGWCPGMATDLHESKITNLLSSNSNTIDYGIVTASGTSNYWVSNQLVSYGAANFTLDAAVVDIKNPSNKIEYARTNPICTNPIVIIRNTGSTILTKLIVEYWVNNNPSHETYIWAGYLNYMDNYEVSLPAPISLWSSITTAGNNVFHVLIKNPNNGTDAYSYNNTMNSRFNLPAIVPANFIINLKTNLAASENKYQLFDESGNQIFIRNNLSNNTLYKDTFNLAKGCYQLVVTDDGGDGLSFYENPNAGNGYISLKKSNGANLITFNPDFGNSIVYNFTIDFPLSFESVNKYHDFNLYPNPAQKQFFVETNGIENFTVNIVNNLGQSIEIPMIKTKNKIEFNSANLAPGLYFIIMRDEFGNAQTQKLMIE